METLMLDILPLLQELLLALAGAAIIWATAYAKRKWGIEIEARHRDALHSAVKTGVEAMFARHPGAASPPVGKAAVDDVWTYVRRSVPDAIKALSPAPDVLDEMIIANIQRLWASRSGQ